MIIAILLLSAIGDGFSSAGLAADPARPVVVSESGLTADPFAKAPLPARFVTPTPDVPDMAPAKESEPTSHEHEQSSTKKMQAVPGLLRRPADPSPLPEGKSVPFDSSIGSILGMALASPTIAPMDRGTRDVIRGTKAKQWYRLTMPELGPTPVWEGYGALNEKGQVEVEKHRLAGTTEEIDGPAPFLLGDSPGWPDSEREAIARGLAAINKRRAERGVGPLLLDDGLCRAAKALAIPYAAGKARAHWGFPDRVRKEGWPYENLHIRNSGFGNTSEGCMQGGSTPEDCVLCLDDSKDPMEGHRQDFEDPKFTHVGIAFAKTTARHPGMGDWTAVVDYGAKQTPGPVPNPKPTPNPNPDGFIYPE